MLGEKLKLRCGAEIKNRIAKAAMSEALADSGNNPGDDYIRLFERWGKGGAGMLITGNIQIDRRHLEHVKNFGAGRKHRHRANENIRGGGKGGRGEGAGAVVAFGSADAARTQSNSAFHFRCRPVGAGAWRAARGKRKRIAWRCRPIFPRRRAGKRGGL